MNLEIVKRQLTTYAQLLLQAVIAARARCVKGDPTAYDLIFPLLAELFCARDELSNFVKGKQTLLDIPALKCQPSLYRALSRPKAHAVSLANLERLMPNPNPSLLGWRPLLNPPRWTHALDAWLLICGRSLGRLGSAAAWQRRVPLRTGQESIKRWIQLVKRAGEVPCLVWTLEDDLKIYGAMRRGSGGGWQGAWLAFDGTVPLDEIVKRWSQILKVHASQKLEESDWEIEENPISCAAISFHSG